MCRMWILYNVYWVYVYYAYTVIWRHKQYKTYLLFSILATGEPLQTAMTKTSVQKIFENCCHRKVNFMRNKWSCMIWFQRLLKEPKKDVCGAQMTTGASSLEATSPSIFNLGKENLIVFSSSNWTWTLDKREPLKKLLCTCTPCRGLSNHPAHNNYIQIHLYSGKAVKSKPEVDAQKLLCPWTSSPGHSRAKQTASPTAQGKIWKQHWKNLHGRV